jgi:hypothetical protein
LCPALVSRIVKNEAEKEGGGLIMKGRGLEKVS